MRAFVGFRPNPPADYLKNGVANPSHMPQFEGVVFDDGTVAVRWMTNFRSHSIWGSFDDFFAVHGHPEYGTMIKWATLEFSPEKVAA